MNLSRMESTQKTVEQSNDFIVHALRRDSDGMLRYTKVAAGSTDVADFHRTDGTQYPGFLDGVDYVDETTEEKTYKNHPHDKYQQYRFDFRNLNYYIDDDGYFVARINGSYDHNAQGPK
jgi:hypothetical protein